MVGIVDACARENPRKEKLTSSVSCAASDRYIFSGGLSFELTEGDLVAVFSQVLQRQWVLRLTLLAALCHACDQVVVEAYGG